MVHEAGYTMDSIKDDCAGKAYLEQQDVFRKADARGRQGS